MRTGRPRSPHKRPSSKLQAAVRASGRLRRVLAQLSGWPSKETLCAVVFGRDVAATPITVRRLERLAKEIKYGGPIFDDEELPRSERMTVSNSEASVV